MHTLGEQLASAEAEIKAAKAQVELRDRLARLKANPDFKALILDEYMTNEAIRCLSGSADMANDAKMRADNLAMAQATGHLRRFLIFIDQAGSVAERSVKQNEELIDELRQEGAE